MSDTGRHGFQQIPGRDRCADCYMPFGHSIHTQDLAAEYIAEAHAMPDSNWHISRNTDGGAAVEDFMRKYAAKNAAAILARRAENVR